MWTFYGDVMSAVGEPRLCGELINSGAIRNRLPSSVVRGVPTICIVPRLLAVSVVDSLVRYSTQRLENSAMGSAL